MSVQNWKKNIIRNLNTMTVVLVYCFYAFYYALFYLIKIVLCMYVWLCVYVCTLVYKIL